MTTVKLGDGQWEKIRDFLRDDPHAYVGKDEGQCRRFVEGVLWITRSGAPWRLLGRDPKLNTIQEKNSLLKADLGRGSAGHLLLLCCSMPSSIEHPA